MFYVQYQTLSTGNWKPSDSGFETFTEAAKHKNMKQNMFPKNKWRVVLFVVID